MSLKTRVKVSGVTNLSDARYCAGMMVNYLGFNVNEQSDNFLSATDFIEISEWVSGVSFVAECENMNVEEVLEAVTNYGVTYVESDSLDVIQELIKQELKCILNIKLNQYNLDHWVENIPTIPGLEMVKISCEDPKLFSLIESSIQPDFDFNLCKAFQIELKHIKDLKGHWSCIEIKATSEEKPGFKDYGELMDILEELEIED